ncbi:MAG: F0F1 ATP synthase subunit epsilon [Gemmataceae bacterium]
MAEPTVKGAVEHTLLPSEATEAADALKGKVRCTVVTPEKAVLDAVADFVILPMFDGELGVLPGRAPLIGRLGAGELRLKTGSTVVRWFIEPGFVQVRNNLISVLTAKAQKAEEVTVALAEKAAADAAAMPSGTPVERANKTKARDRAQGMKKVAAHNSGSPAAAH